MSKQNAEQRRAKDRQRRRKFVAQQRALGRKPVQFWLTDEEKRSVDAFMATIRPTEESPVRFQLQKQPPAPAPRPASERVSTGVEALREVTKSANADRQNLIVRFPQPPAADIRAELRSRGFKFDGATSSWSGTGALETLRPLVHRGGGTVAVQTDVTSCR